MPEPECMFDIKYFRQNPQIFYSFAHELWPGNHQPTPTHHFIALLEKKGKLLRNYTQNIDALEQKASIQNVLECHGSFRTASCMTCGRKVDGLILHQQIVNKQIAYCRVCHKLKEDGTTPISPVQTDPCYGVMKPDIVFFGEGLPKSYDRHLESDRNRCDLLIVIGSSLKVHPVASLLSLMPAPVPTVLINREVVGGPNKFDVELLGNCDDVILALCQKLNWSLVNGEMKRSSHSPPSTSSAMVHRPPNRYLFNGYTPTSHDQEDEDEPEEEDHDVEPSRTVLKPRSEDKKEEEKREVRREERREERRKEEEKRKEKEETKERNERKEKKENKHNSPTSPSLHRPSQRKQTNGRKDHERSPPSSSSSPRPP